MRTTLDLDDELLKEAKRRAGDRGATLTATIEDALRLAFQPRPKGKGKRRRVRIPTHRGGLRPGVDLDNTAALLDLMELDELRARYRR